MLGCPGLIWNVPFGDWAIIGSWPGVLAAGDRRKASAVDPALLDELEVFRQIILIGKEAETSLIVNTAANGRAKRYSKRNAAAQKTMRLCLALTVDTAAGVFVTGIRFSNVRPKRTSLPDRIVTKLKCVIKRIAVGQSGIGERRIRW